MNYYKRAGVGRYSEDEQLLLNAIEQLIEQKHIPVEQLPECHSLDELIELKNYLESYTEEPLVEQTPPESLVEQERQQSEELQDEEETPPELPENEIPGEEPKDELPPHEEPLQEVEESDGFISSDYDPFADPIIERSYTAQNGEPTGAEYPTDEGDPLELEDSKQTPLNDLPPTTKRRAAEQTADTLLKGYKQFIPIPFKWLSKFPESKIEKMAFDGVIDLTLEVSEGTTFDDYIKQTNEQIDEIFEVDEDTLNDIREPLIEVLMEQEMQLTPVQRLTAAIFSHLIQMFTVAIDLRKQNNRVLSYQKHLTFLMQGYKAAA